MVAIRKVEVSGELIPKISIDVIMIVIRHWLVKDSLFVFSDEVGAARILLIHPRSSDFIRPYLSAVKFSAPSYKR